MPSNPPIVAYDVDGVLVSFIVAFLNHAHFKFGKLCAHWPKDWRKWTSWMPEDCAPQFSTVWKSIHENPEEFWGNLRAIPNDITPGGITPDVYLSTFSFPQWIRLKNLHELGFPIAPMIQCPSHEAKMEMIHRYGITHVIEDRHKNWCQINKHTAATCYLITRPWNENAWELGLHEFGDNDWYYDTVVHHISQFESITRKARLGLS